MRKIFFLLLLISFAMQAQAVTLHEKSENLTSRKDSIKFIRNTVIRVAQGFDLPAELIWALIAVESGFNIHATSTAGAQGLMQLMPGTASELGVRDPYDPAQNITGGARYLKKLVEMFDGDWEQALAAYNAGPWAVMKRGEVPPVTYHFINRVMKIYRAEMLRRVELKRETT